MGSSVMLSSSLEAVVANNAIYNNGSTTAGAGSGLYLYEVISSAVNSNTTNNNISAVRYGSGLQYCNI